MQTSDWNHKSGGCVQAPLKCCSDNELICYCRPQSGAQTGSDCPVPPLHYTAYHLFHLAEHCIPLKAEIPLPSLNLNAPVR